MLPSWWLALMLRLSLNCLDCCKAWKLRRKGHHLPTIRRVQRLCLAYGVSRLLNCYADHYVPVPVLLFAVCLPVREYVVLSENRSLGTRTKELRLTRISPD
jgi:hypothetical protein